MGVRLLRSGARRARRRHPRHRRRGRPVGMSVPTRRLRSRRLVSVEECSLHPSTDHRGGRPAVHVVTLGRRHRRVRRRTSRRLGVRRSPAHRRLAGGGHRRHPSGRVDRRRLLVLVVVAVLHRHRRTRLGRPRARAAPTNRRRTERPTGVVHVGAHDRRTTHCVAVPDEARPGRFHRTRHRIPPPPHRPPRRPAASAPTSSVSATQSRPSPTASACRSTPSSPSTISISPT